MMESSSCSNENVEVQPQLKEEQDEMDILDEVGGNNESGSDWNLSEDEEQSMSDDEQLILGGNSSSDAYSSEFS